MQKQMPLFATEEQPQPQQRPQPAPALRGIIQRGIDELQATRQADLIKRIHELKFDKREAAQHGDI